MAKLRVFSVHDEKLKVYNTPFFFSHLGEATRAWEELCNDPKTTIAKHPTDFTLFEVGEFDTDKGESISHNPPRKIQTAIEVIRAPSL